VPAFELSASTAEASRVGNALLAAAEDVDAGAAWYTRAASVIAELVGAHRVAFWRLRDGNRLVVERYPYGFDEREREMLREITVDETAADTAAQVTFAARDAAGVVVAGGGDEYLAALKDIGIRVHATVAWTLGNRRLGMMAVYDPYDESFSGDPPALRVAASVTALIAEVKESHARHSALVTVGKQRDLELALVANLVASLTQLDDLDAIAHEAARAAAKIVSRQGQPQRRASFLRRAGDEVTAVAEYDELGVRLRGRYLLTDSEALDHVMRTGELMLRDFTDSTGLPPGVDKVARKHRFRSAAIVPVRSGGEVIGVIAVAARDPDGFDHLQVRWLAAIANIVGLAIGNTQRTQALRQTAERSQQLETLKGEFLNVAAHELRSPLGIVKGYVSMLEEGSVSSTNLQEIYGLLGSKANEMTRLIDEMLETAALEDVGVALSIERVDLLDVVDEAVTAMRPMLAGPHRLVVTGERTSIPVDVDRRRLTTVLTNLIDNAIKYSPAGGKIEIAWSLQGDTALVSVRDHGIGIRSVDQRSLFRRFGRIVTPDNSHIRGTGLGLYLAREIMRSYSGDITVSSTPGRGSTFTLSVPLGSVQSAQKSGPPAVSGLGSRAGE
jgi:signal transduction histidine kinase